MHTTFALSALLFALTAHTQSSPASSAATPTANTLSQPVASNSAAASQTEDLEELVNYLIPTASITSLSPAQVRDSSITLLKLLTNKPSLQSSKVASDAAAFLSAYTASSPLSALESKIYLDGGVGALFGSTTPSPAQISSIQALVGEAQSGLVDNPSAFISSANALVSPFPFATDIENYENGFVDGLRTVVASDLSLSVPPPSSASSSSTGGGVAPARPTGLMAGGVAVAAGLLGAALL